LRVSPAQWIIAGLFERAVKIAQRVVQLPHRVARRSVSF